MLHVYIITKFRNDLYLLRNIYKFIYIQRWWNLSDLTHVSEYLQFIEIYNILFNCLQCKQIYEFWPNVWFYMIVYRTVECIVDYSIYFGVFFLFFFISSVHSLRIIYIHKTISVQWFCKLLCIQYIDGYYRLQNSYSTNI